MLQQELFEKIINQLQDKLIYLTFYFQGEPYLNPEFLKMVNIAHTRKVFTSTSTNAHYLNDANAKATIESGLDRLIISIDGTTQETYEQYRVGGDLSKVIEGTKNIIKWKRQLRSKTPHIIFQFLVVKPNEHQLEEVKQLANELGVDEVKFKTAQVYDYENGNPLIPDNEQYARYKKGIDGKWRIKNELLNQCWRMWSSCVITWDGKIVPCCFDKDAKYQLGSLQLNSFSEIWNSKPYNEFRKSVLRSRKEIDICSNCSEGTRVWAD
jgi:radical SAM protein with 4Fe4S-binding SPASM domain